MRLSELRAARELEGGKDKDAEDFDEDDSRPLSYKGHSFVLFARGLYSIALEL